MKVFFYGLFMDKDLLGQKAIVPAAAVVGFAPDFALHIGQRATLVRRRGATTYGVLMNIAQNDAGRLYAEPSVADYADSLLQLAKTLNLPNSYLAEIRNFCAS